MQFSVLSDHIAFFHTHHYIVFEKLAKKNALVTLASDLKEMLHNRLKKENKVFLESSINDLFLAGRDSWRESQIAKSWTLKSQFATIASQLTKKKPLYIGYDQVLLHSSMKTPILPPFFSSSLSISSRSCLQGIACALLLQISPLSVEEGHLSDNPLSSLVQGSGIFFHPDFPFSLEYFQPPNRLCMQFLIVYIEKNAIYKRENRDPHTHALKKWGYQFGDRISQTTHPCVTPINPFH